MARKPPPSPESRPEVPAADKPTRKARPRARRVSAGDIGPTSSPQAIEDFAVRQNVIAAEAAQVNALEDILRGRAPNDAAELMRTLLKEQQALARELPTEPDDELADDWRTGGYPYKNLLSRKNYERQKYRLQVELLKLQAWVKERGQKIVVLFEGRDAAGKGGTIKRFMENLNPRGARVVALDKPTEQERGQWYFQRYIQHLPSGGEMVLFDRSWYNRAGVERVMGFCTEDEYREFLRSCPEFERMLVRSGIILVKYWFSVSDQEQERRFQARMNDPTKRWKLSPMDLQSRERWVEYSKAKDAMFASTDIKQAPWYVVNADSKPKARLNCITHLLSLIPYEDLTPEPLVLPPRQDEGGYVRPPITDQTFVPEAF
jgi:polyphosphate kinase 2